MPRLYTLLRLLYSATTTILCHDYYTLLRLLYSATTTVLCYDYYTRLRLVYSATTTILCWRIMGATCLSAWLFQLFPSFFENWHLQGGSQSNWWIAVNLGDRIWKVRPAHRRAGRTFLPSGKFQYSHQILGRRSSSKSGWFGESATCFLKGGSHLGGRAPRIQKMSKNESSHNEVLYSRKCSYIPGEYFEAIPGLPAPI